VHRRIRRFLATSLLLALFSEPLFAATASFTSKDYPVGPAPVVVAVADLNGDGKLDLAALTVGANLVGGVVSVLLGNGDGSFQPARNFPVTANSIAIADVNGDGKPDLVLGGAPPSVQIPTCGQSATQIMVGNGDGTFSPPQEVALVPSIDSLTAAGDVNGDGKADLIVDRVVLDSSCPAGGVSLFLGNGDGSFQPEVQLGGSDINRDGIGDLVLPSLNKLTVLLGTGKGNFRPLVPGPNAQSGNEVLADFNGDKNDDEALLVTQCSGVICFPQNRTTNVGIALGNGDGTYRSAQVFFSGGHSSELGVGDFNGDGKLDVAAINFGTSLLTILLGKGDGTLPGLSTFDVGSGPDTFTVADLNGDNLPDVVTANLNDNTISVLLNTSPTSGADLSVAITAAPEPVSLTQHLTYTLQIINAGPQDATNVSLVQTLPVGVNFISASITQGSCVQSNLVVTCAVNKLVSGDSATATVIVVPTSTGSASTSATVSGAEVDPDTANNTVSHSTRVDPMFQLTVTKAGAGGGVVVGSPINCGSTCKASFPTGTPVLLQVQPNNGSVFAGWGGACASNGLAPGCDVTMNADQTVTANFDIGPNFAISADNPTLTMAAGSSASGTISIFPEGQSFDNAITLGCSVSGPLPKPSCSLSPASLTPGAAHVVTTLTVTAPALASVAYREKSWLIALFATVLSFFAMAILIPTDTKARRRTRMRAYMAFFAALMLSSCAGSNHTSPLARTASNFTVTVTATSGQISKNVAVAVTVK